MKISRNVQEALENPSFERERWERDNDSCIKVLAWRGKFLILNG
jgi:hypothetical protein